MIASRGLVTGPTGGYDPVEITPVRARTGLRAVAVFEGVKGALVLAAGCGALALVHRDLQALAEEVVSHFHLNPASRYPRIFLEAADRFGDGRLRALAALAAAYATIRLLEAWGLWRERRWAEWLGAASGGLYVPVEIYELVRRVTSIRLLLLLGNTAVVLFLLRQLSLGPPAPSENEPGWIQRSGSSTGSSQ